MVPSVVTQVLVLQHSRVPSTFVSTLAGWKLLHHLAPHVAQHVALPVVASEHDWHWQKSYEAILCFQIYRGATTAVATNSVRLGAHRLRSMLPRTKEVVPIVSMVGFPSPVWKVENDSIKEDRRML